MVEKVKRLMPKPETLRELFLKSGNLCAFPDCNDLMMNAGGNFIGQVCHIEAAGEEGERFNANMTNEERRHISNLMLMCYEHHTVTNDVKEYPANILQSYKCQHERRFSEPERVMSSNFKDWTQTEKVSQVKNLRSINELLCWEYNTYELKKNVDEFNQYMIKFNNIPLEVRDFVGVLAMRIVRMRSTRSVSEGMSGYSILAYDVLEALHINKDVLKKKISQLDLYTIGGIDEISSDLGEQEAIHLYNLKSGWPVWVDLVEFAQKKNINIKTFTEDLDFSGLDK